MSQVSKTPGKRFRCEFVSASAGKTLCTATFVTPGPQQALGAFVHLDVPEREAGHITVCDEGGAVLLWAAWPPGPARKC